jgi:hypothetical protein
MPVRAPANDEFRKPDQFGANSSGVGNADRCQAERGVDRAPAVAFVAMIGFHQSPQGHVGATTGFLATDYAKLVTGETVYADGGYHIVGRRPPVLRNRER